MRAPQMGQLLGTVCGKLLGSSTLFQSECRNINCCTSSAAAMRVYDPSKPPWMQQQWQPQQPWAPQTSADSAASAASSLAGPAGRLFGRRKKVMTSIWVDSRKRVAGNDADFEFDIGQTVHLQGSARLSVFKIRVADTFLSTDRGTYLYWRDQALNSLNCPSARTPARGWRRGSPPITPA